MNEPGFPSIEKSIFFLCAKTAETPVKLAKCVVKLFAARDFRRQQNYADSYPEIRRHKIFKEVISKNLHKIPSWSKTSYKTLIPVREFYAEKHTAKKREINEKTGNAVLINESSRERKNLKNLKLLQTYFQRLTRYNNYIEKLNKENVKFFQQQNLPVDIKVKKNAALKGFDPETFMNILVKFLSKISSLYRFRMANFLFCHHK